MAKATAKQIAWRQKFAQLYGGKKKVKSGGKKSMAKKKKGNGNGGKKQGILSWLTSVISVGIGLSDVFVRMGEASAQPKGYKWQYFAQNMIKDYTGLEFSSSAWSYGGFKVGNLLRGYAPIGAAYGFKTGVSLLAKKAPIKSLIPRIS